MGGMAARYHFDGRPVPAAAWREGPIGLGSVESATNGTATVRERFYQCGDFCVVLDGRIDNREELYAATGADGVPLSIVTDAHMLLCAYRHWDEDCARRILGDFAFCIWDRRRRQMFCGLAQTVSVSPVRAPASRPGASRRAFFLAYGVAVRRVASASPSCAAGRSKPTTAKPSAGLDRC
jgi:Glutamine amidotransferase domain